MSRRSTEEAIDRHELSVDLAETSIQLIKAHLQRDVYRATHEHVTVKCKDGNLIIDSENGDVKDIVETYSKVYQEVGFLFEVNKQRSDEHV